MAADPTSAQSDNISQIRSGLATLVDTLYQLDQARIKAAALGGIDAYVAGAFAGSNADIVAADVDAAITSALKLRSILIDSTGSPTADLLAITKVAK